MVAPAGRFRTGCFRLLVGLTTLATATAAEPTPVSPERPLTEEAFIAELQKLAMPSVWTTGGSLRAGGGYRDNVLLSSLNPVAAGFATAGGDFMLNRLPTDGTEVSVFVTGDYTHFVDEPAADPEALLLAQGEVKRDLGRAWTAGLRGQYVFINQVFDVSATEADLTTVTARGHLISAMPSLVRELGRGWTATVTVDGSRQIFDAPLDKYWEAIPAGTMVREFGRWAEAALTYRYDRRWYDDRPPLDGAGESLPGKLQFESHEVEFRPRFFLDAGRRWSTQLRLGVLVNRDNGGGYFDYLRYSAAVQLKYRTADWALRAEVRWRGYDYDVQRASETDPELRSKTDFGFTLRGERRLARKWTVFAQYERESSNDTLPRSEYEANTLLAGLEREL